MKEIFINKDNLVESQIDEEVIRVKGLLINDKNEILLGYSHNCYQFPGGHLENGETIYEALKREIKEETGMNLDTNLSEPFMMIKYYNKNYFNTNKNRCNKIYYMIIKTNFLPNLSETNYTDDEIQGNYKLKTIKLKDVKKILTDNANMYEISKTITNEMLIVLDEYFENSN